MKRHVNTKPKNISIKFIKWIVDIAVRIEDTRLHFSKRKQTRLDSEV